ncbi:hypothetical protein [Bradyrhizobium hipponense]|nr:hypothetical protein [Bradyrhizobium hipponense]
MNLDTRKNEAVMAGLVPAIHAALPRGTKNVDARHKAGHDDAERAST